MKRRPVRARWVRVACGAVGALGVCAPIGGCLKRKIRITSEPPGAVAYVNDKQIGITPAEADFTFYGRYSVRLDHPGYEPYLTERTAHAPPWEYPVIDLLFEVLPITIGHTVDWHFEMVPVPTPGTVEAEKRQDLLLFDAQRMRERVEDEAALDGAAVDGAVGNGAR